MLQSKSRFEPLIIPNEDQSTDFGPLTDLTLSYGLDLGMTLFKLTGHRKLSEDTGMIYGALRSLSALLVLIRPSDVKIMDKIQFSNKLYLIERRVVSLIETGDLTNQDQDGRCIFFSFSHAALIYIYSKLRGLPKSAKLFGKLAERLRASLQPADLVLFSQKLPRMICWILLVGAEAAVEASNSAWYVSQLANLEVVWEARGKGEMMFLAEEFLWPEKGYEK